MGKKYVATIMNRHYLGENAFIFNTSHTVIGEIDEKTGILKDRNGNEYAPMLSPGLMGTEIPYAYSNIMELDQVKEIVGGNHLSLKESISEYEFLCKKVLYYVGKIGEAPFCITLNMDNLLETAKSTASQATSRSGDNSEEIEEDLSDGIEELTLDIINGKYSLKELREIRNNIEANSWELESLLETIDLQIEASEKGESAIQLKEDPIEKIEISEELLKKQSSYIDIEELFKKVTKTLIAQDEPARRVIAEIARKEMDIRKKKEGILLTGATGVGKTELMRLIAKNLNRPFHKIDATQLTIPGYVGKDIEEMLWDLYIECGQDVKKAEEAIIFFDEIDKKGSSKKSDVSGQGVLNVLLPFIEGATYDACPDMKNTSNKVKINTSNMIVILGGAYTDVYKNLIEKNEIGFGNTVSTTPKYRKATTQDIIERGMMTDEFMGRVSVIKLNDLDVAAIKRIMLESDESAMKIQKQIFDKLGVKLTFTDGYTTAIAKNAYEKKTGARGLNGIIDETTWRAFEEIYKNIGEYEEAILTEETVKDPTKYQLVKKKEKSN